MNSSSANPASSSANPASSSADTGVEAQSFLNLTVNSSIDEIPMDIPPTKDKMIPPNSSLWRHLRAKHNFYPEGYKKGYFIKDQPITSESDTGYTFNYKSSDPSKQALEARGTLHELLGFLKEGQLDTKKSDKSIVDHHALHQYLACRHHYQKFYSQYGLGKK